MNSAYGNDEKSYGGKDCSVDDNWGPRPRTEDAEIASNIVGAKLLEMLDKGTKPPDAIHEKCIQYCNKRGQYEGDGCRRPNHTPHISCIGTPRCRVNIVLAKTNPANGKSKTKI